MGWSGLHPAREYQASTGAVKGSKILSEAAAVTATPSHSMAARLRQMATSYTDDVFAHEPSCLTRVDVRSNQPDGFVRGRRRPERLNPGKIFFNLDSV